MPAEKKLSIHILRGNAARRSSSALATTASTCQIPGGTSLLVGCVLGKKTVAREQPRSSLKQRPSEEGEDLKFSLPSDDENGSDTPDGKERAKISAVPRSMSINSPPVSNPSQFHVSEKFSGMNITHLFDKVVSATDCRSSGHFVLPKRKVEEHFPPLSKPGGVWMSLVDDAGKKWTFEFCFWFSKESRIYYFKKFHPYVQARNLRGGDTVYFSRLEPEGTLLIGARKQEADSPKHSISAKPNASKDELEEMDLPDRDLKFSTEEGNSVLDETALREDIPSTPSTEATRVDYGSNKATYKRKRRKLSLHLPRTLDTKSVDHLASDEAVMIGRESVTPESFEHVNMKPGSLGSGGNRLGLTMEDYCEWEDIQNLFRAPPGATVTTTCVEGHEIEEYKDPPILVKKTFYSAEIPEDDQWVKCDDCGCWRRLPADAFVPASWICSDNEWDLRRAHCNAPPELSDLEMDELLGGLTEAEMETGSETESYDNDSEIPDSPTEEEDNYLKQPRSWSEAYGQMQKHAYQLVLSEKCKSSTTAKSLLKPVAGEVRGSSELNNLSGRSPGRKSPQVHVKVGKGHQMCTGCSKFIGSAAQACKRCGTLTEYGARKRGKSSGGYM
ncbi:hypothetical protein M758_4G183600 [Ceratodon purpureus]|nr:hypothetical protein M758_4G183600 [Ceratodon purpureus]